MESIKPHKLAKPPDLALKDIKGVVVYWSDPALSMFSDDPDEDYNLNVGSKLKYEGGLQCANLKQTNSPPFDGSNEIYFDILFFDWGGMCMGNSLLETFCEYILEHAEEHPSKLYVMCSTFTTRAMNEALIEMKNRPANVLLSVKEFIDFFKMGDGYEIQD